MRLAALSEIIVLVGIPASGKTTLARARYKNHTLISLDVLKSRQRENSEILRALESGESIVIDNTNTTRKTRSRYVEYARTFNARIRAVFIRCPLDLVSDTTKLALGENLFQKSRYEYITRFSNHRQLRRVSSR
ncbi:MAG: AAA family ATPase [Nitrososphaerales archaeon]